MAAYAAKHGIETIRPVACGEAPISGRQPTSVLITAGLIRSRPLTEVWSELDPEQRATRKIKNHIIDEIARLLAHAHQNGFYHCDLHSGNLLLDAVAPGRFRPLFVDLHSVRVGKPVSDRGVIRNLAQFNQWFRLHAPLTDRIRFLRRYLYWRDALQAEGAFGRKLTCSQSTRSIPERPRRPGARSVSSPRPSCSNAWNALPFLMRGRSMPNATSASCAAGDTSNA